MKVFNFFHLLDVDTFWNIIDSISQNSKRVNKLLLSLLLSVNPDQINGDFTKVLDSWTFWGSDFKVTLITNVTSRLLYLTSRLRIYTFSFNMLKLLSFSQEIWSNKIIKTVLFYFNTKLLKNLDKMFSSPAAIIESSLVWDISCLRLT